MKKTFNFMAILGVLLIIGTVLIGSCSAQTSTDYLKVKGALLKGYDATITIYAQDESASSKSWKRIASKTVGKRYRLRLATDQSYQVYFMSDAGHTKVIHITKGKRGRYVQYLDIDFEGSTQKHACMYQVPDGSYTLQTKSQFFTSASFGTLVTNEPN